MRCARLRQVGAADARPEAVWRWLLGPAFGAGLVWVCPAVVLLALLAVIGATPCRLLRLDGRVGRRPGRGRAARAAARALASDEGFLGAFRPGLLLQADYGAIVAEIPAPATLVGLGFVAAILNASGIEPRDRRAR
ncbi:MAG: hypothetical protein U1E59_10485 [Amaricoccus sp.]